MATDSGKKNILTSSAKMACATLLSRILGLIREQAQAWVFGASGVTDAFLIAYRIPNLLRDLLAEGAFSSAFVPTFTEMRQKDELRARRLMWSLFILLSCVTGTVSLGIIIWAPELTNLFAPDFAKNPEKLRLTIQLLRIMAPYFLLVSIAALFMGALNSLKVFFIPSLSSGFFNLIHIFFTLTFPAIFIARGYPAAWSLGFGVLFGGMAQVLVQLPLIIKKKYGPLFDKEVFKLWTPETKRIVNRVGIGSMGIAATQINLVVSSILATNSGVGAVSWLTYAFRLFQLPVGILGVSIAGSNLVHFSEEWKNGKREAAVDCLKSSFELSLMLLLPSMALMMALSHESAHLIYEHGAFDAHDTMMTASALDWYLLGLPFYGLYKVFAPTFYALDRPKIPVITSSICVVLNMIFCIVATPRFGFPMLAFGTTLTMFLNVSILIYFLRKILDLELNFFLNKRVVKFSFSAVLCFLTLKLIAPHIFNFQGAIGMQAISLAFLCVIGGLVYAFALVLMGESGFLLPLVKGVRRFLKK